MGAPKGLLPAPSAGAAAWLLRRSVTSWLGWRSRCHLSRPSLPGPAAPRPAQPCAPGGWGSGLLGVPTWASVHQRRGEAHGGRAASRGSLRTGELKRRPLPGQTSTPRFSQELRPRAAQARPSPTRPSETKAQESHPSRWWPARNSPGQSPGRAVVSPARAVLPLLLMCPRPPPAPELGLSFLGCVFGHLPSDLAPHHLPSDLAPYHLPSDWVPTWGSRLAS